MSNVFSSGQWIYYVLVSEFHPRIILGMEIKKKSKIYNNGVFFFFKFL